MFIKRFAGVLILMLSAALFPLLAQGTSDLDTGKQLFVGMCARCHGVGGTGGEGPNLNRPVLTRAQDDDGLLAIIRDGIPDRGMPRVRRLSVTELRELVTYVRSLGRVSVAANQGNPKAGRAVYEKQGCSSCHVIEGDGGSLGPELTTVGGHRAPDFLRQALVDPGAALPKGVQTLPGRGLNEFLPVRAVTRDGKEVRGERLNEDSFTIQIRSGNQLYSFRKADLQ